MVFNSVRVNDRAVYGITSHRWWSMILTNTSRSFYSPGKMRTHRSGPSGKCKLHWNEAEIWRQADSRKNEFLATFAHELRNLSRQ
jgi:hypothetical protein